MGGAPQQRVTTSHDTALGWIILFGVMIALFFLFWKFFEYQVKSAYRWVRWSEMKAISAFVDDSYTVHWQNDDINYKDLMNQIAEVPSSKLDSDTLTLLSHVSMYPLRMPGVGILGLIGMWCLLWGPGTEYRRKLDLNGLISTQSKIFPIITPFVKFNPRDQPPRAPGAPVPAELPAFAEALAPEEWVAYNQIPVPDSRVNEQAALIAFSRQLGPPWRGTQKMPPYKQILLAAFCLKASRKRKDADEMMGRIACCWTFENGLNLSKDKSLLRDAQKVLRDKSLSEKVLKNCNQHGFETTVMLRGLATAREEGGVLAPAQFVWLRAFDRTLWYPLNNLGRQSYHMEALGAMAHYKAERMTRRPIPRPKVQDAVKSISEYMKSARARPIPPLDYSKSKKKPQAAGAGKKT
jgi:intracellular multiplication protein IcmP